MSEGLEKKEEEREEGEEEDDANQSDCLKESKRLWGKKGVSVTQVEKTTVVGVEDESEIFRSVWKFYKRNQADLAAYVRALQSTEVEETRGGEVTGKKRRRPEPRKVPCIDFNHLENSPTSLRDLVQPFEVPTKQPVDSDVHVKKAYGITGRPGFVFIPNPFKTIDKEAYWVSQLAVNYAQGSISERNVLSSGITAESLDPGLRWGTLGFHYDWKNRQYTEAAQSPFPEDLARLAKDICACVGDSIHPETAIINYYRKGATMGGHKDDAEWTDEAPVVSISFGNAGIYVLGGNSQTDAGPPPPIPIIVRSGDVVLLGGPSRMNLHGVPCMLKDTCPSDLTNAFATNADILSGNWTKDASAATRPDLAARLSEYLNETRINVNVRQVRATKAILNVLRKAPK